MKTILPIEIIELENESYHLMIDVKFSDSKSGSLIIDTGASKTVLDSEFTSEFITEYQEIAENESSGINAMITGAQVGLVPEILFGKLKITNYNCLILDLSHINQLYQKYSDKYIAGLVGSDFLLKHQATISYKSKTLTLNA